MLFDSNKVKKFEPLNVKNVLRKVSQEDILRYYVGEEPSVGSLVRSPLREDRNPTCSFYYSGQKLKMKDFASGFSGDCFDVVQAMYQVGMRDALKIINKDLNLNLGQKAVHEFSKQALEYKRVTKPPVRIQIETKRFDPHELSYWSSFGISQKTLTRFNVYSVSKLYVNKRLLAVSTKRDPIYAYFFPGTSHFKIYRPLNSNFKWLSNVTSDDIQGLEQAKYSDKLIITSSMKDAMTLTSIGYTAVAPQGEACSFTKSMLDLISKYPEVYLMYDNDEPGRVNAKARASEIGGQVVEIPKDSGEKDPSDYARKYGLRKLKDLCQNIILINTMDYPSRGTDS